VTAAGCGKTELQAYNGQEFLLDTPIAMTVYATQAAEAEQALAAAFAEFSRIDRIATRYAKEDAAEPSEVERMNAAAGEQAVPVSTDIAFMLQKAADYYALSEGTFRLAIGPLMDLWGFGTDHAHIAAAEDLAAILPLTAQEKIVFDPQAGTVFLQERGMSLDFGGIAKGYATDLAAEALRAHGIQHALIDAGGNIYALGAKPDGTPWRIGIRDPRQSGEILGVIEAVDQAVVSSGDYERFFIEDGVRYHHIMDPRDGKPARGAQQSTVIAPSSLDADILSTVTFILGRDKSEAILKEKGLAGAFVAEDGEISLFPDGKTLIRLER
jgi:thiamine biosynthesis lipoprotein